MRRRFQFNIRALLCVTFVIACWLAGYTYKLREAKRLQRETDEAHEQERQRVRLENERGLGR